MPQVQEEEPERPEVVVDGTVTRTRRTFRTPPMLSVSQLQDPRITALRALGESAELLEDQATNDVRWTIAAQLASLLEDDDWSLRTLEAALGHAAGFSRSNIGKSVGTLAVRDRVRRYYPEETIPYADAYALVDVGEPAEHWMSAIYNAISDGISVRIWLRRNPILGPKKPPKPRKRSPVWTPANLVTATVVASIVAPLSDLFQGALAHQQYEQRQEDAAVLDGNVELLGEEAIPTVSYATELAAMERVEAVVAAYVEWLREQVACGAAPPENDEVYESIRVEAMREQMIADTAAAMDLHLAQLFRVEGIDRPANLPVVEGPEATLLETTDWDAALLRLSEEEPPF